MFKFNKTKNKKSSLLANQHDDAIINAQNDDYSIHDIEDSHQEMMPRKRSNSSSGNKKKNRRKISERYMLNFNQNDISPLDDDNDEEYIKKNKKCICCCSWRCVCISSTAIILTGLLIFSLIVYFFVAPQFAQNTLDNACMDIMNGTIYNPTNSSITLNTTIKISNAGFLNGELESSTVTVSTDGIQIGMMTMPALNTLANQNTIITVSSVLTITNTTHFQKSCKELLQNIDQIWHLSANDLILTVDTGIIGKINYDVNINKDLVLKGANLYNFIASNFNVDAATNYTVTTSSNLNFISNSIFTFILPDTLLSVYYKDIYVGYAPINGLSMKPGLNIITNQSLIIESYPDRNNNSNRDILNEFFSDYIAGENQKVTMKGPISSDTKGYPSTVIDGILEETVIALGYEKGTLAFGGLVTSATQTGWKVNGKTVRGAYANFLNPLNVPVQIVDMSATAYLPQTIKYHVVLVPLVEEYNCEASIFADLSIGPGIYKDDPTKTWIDVDANAKVTYFSIASPPKGSSGDSCMGLYDFNCCFATLTAAYACKLNPGIQHHPSDGQLNTDYMPMHLDANITMLIDNKFKILTSYNQPFFPLFFGWEVYGGYATDLELSCKDYTFK